MFAMKQAVAIDACRATERKLAEGSGRRDCQAHPGMSNPLIDGPDILPTVMRFLGDDAFLFVASVSTSWRGVWGKRPMITSPRWAVQSCSCLDWALACGLDIWDNPCLHAATEGRLDVLQHAVSLGFSRECMPVCERAAGAGKLEVLKWCRANGYPWGKSILRAAEGGHLEALKWCVANGCPRTVARQVSAENPSWMIPFCAIYAAAEAGHLDIVRWCRERGDPWGPEACFLAARGGHFELFRWMRANGCPWSARTMQGAVEAGDHEMLMWCVADGCPRSSRPGICALAAQRGELEILKWCVENHQGGDRDELSCEIAAAHGHLEVVQWLRANGYPWGKFLCYSAMSGGHFEVLKWSVENGCDWNYIPPDSKRAFKGRLSILLWAIANGCPWMRSKEDFTHLCRYVAEGGDLEILQWCEEFHVIPTHDMLRAAAKKGHVHVLEWLRANGRLSGAHIDTYLCYLAASIAGSLETVRWCRANGHPWGQKTCEGAARTGSLKLLQWCRANGCPWDKGSCKAAAERGDLEMLAWCRANGCPWDMSLQYCARLKGNEEVADWCRAHAHVAVRESRALAWSLR